MNHTRKVILLLMNHRPPISDEVQDLEMRTITPLYSRNLRSVSLFSAFISISKHQRKISVLQFTKHVIADGPLFDCSPLLEATPVLDLCDYIGPPTIAYVHIAQHPRSIPTYRDNAAVTSIIKPSNTYHGCHADNRLEWYKYSHGKSMTCS